MVYRTDANKVVDGKDEENGSGLNLDTLQHRIHDLENEISDLNSDHTKALINDSITNLPTSLIFEDRISQAMAFSSRAENIMSVAILNINMFNRINNTLGQVVSEEYLRAVSQRLTTILRSSDTVSSMTMPGQADPSLARLNDDEFGILLTSIDSTESLTYVINRIQEKLSGKIVVAENELFLTTTIGLALYPTDGDSPKALIENARAAQQHAKSMLGRNNYQFFSQEINQLVIDQMRLELDMNNALESNHFKMLYQPKIDTVSGHISSMEALIRWDHPEKGLVMPQRFIPAAEKSGLIVEIGKWSLNVVCSQVKKWVDMGLSDLRVSVNISGVEFVDDCFVDSVMSALKDSGLNAEHLELELTESTIMSDLEKSSRIIDDLRYRGVTVTLDDFGTGYSSFSYLGSLNFDWIKLDRKFLIDAIKHERSGTLYAGMVSMAKEIGLKIVSEGVENQAEYNYVRKMGVDEIQGYMVGKPIDSSSMLDTLLVQNSGQTKKVM
jgi:diguanylate cyclase (GGDEF)-like protein